MAPGVAYAEFGQFIFGPWQCRERRAVSGYVVLIHCLGVTHLNLSLRAQGGNLVARAGTQLRKSYVIAIARRC